ASTASSTATRGSDSSSNKGRNSATGKVQVGTSVGAHRYPGLVPRQRGDIEELTLEVVRSGLGDARLDERAGPQRAIGQEVQQLVLPRAPGRDRGVFLARAFDEHLLDEPDARLVFAQRAALDDHPQSLEPRG